MTHRIGLVCPYSLDHPGGVATHVLGLAQWLRSRGHDAFVVAPGSGRSAAEVRQLGRPIAFRFNGSVAHLAIRPQQIAQARRELADADIVHVHEPLTPGVAFAAARAARDRLVVTHHAHFRPGLLTGMLRLRSALLPERRSIAVSSAAAETAQRVTGVEPAVVPNAITMGGPPEPGTHRDIVLFLGRLDEPRKGYSTFAALARQVPEVRFVAIGPGQGGSPHVEELGPLHDQERDGWLTRAKVLVAPNRFGESFGMVLIEALAQGCAVVASDLPAFRAVAGHGAPASFFPIDDVATAAERLRARLASPHDPVAAWQSVRRFSWDVVGPQVESVYGLG